MTERGQSSVSADARDVLKQLGCERAPGANEHTAEGILQVDGKVWRVVVTRAGESVDPVKARLARVLTDMAEGNVVALTQCQLALLVGASRGYIQKALYDLRQDGVAQPGYRCVTIVDPDALRRAGETTAAGR